MKKLNAKTIYKIAFPFAVIGVIANIVAPGSIGIIGNLILIVIALFAIAAYISGWKKKKQSDDDEASKW